MRMLASVGRVLNGIAGFLHALADFGECVIDSTSDTGGGATTATAGGQGESDEEEGDEQRFHAT